MTSAPSPAHRAVLSEKLAESLALPLPVGTPRRVCGTIGLPGKATAVIGMRRAGKTTFVHQLRHERHQGGARREDLPYLNLEDERLAGLNAEHLGFVIDEHLRQTSRAGSKAAILWCFDEIQVVPGWERFVRRLLDAGGVDVVVTGSSAALLSRELATAMRGRAWEVPLYPFSFAEALAHGGQLVPDDPTVLGSRQRVVLERAFAGWLVAGGFPEAQGLETATRRQLLRDYVDVAMLRDVVERHRVSNVTGLRWLVRQLLGNAASPFSVEKFHGALKSQGLAIARDTVHQLLAYLEDCFLVRLVWMESSSERQRMVNPRKAYPIDPGLIPVYDRSGRANLGHALETAVLIELERRRYTVTYVRTPAGHEVDFLARGPGGEVALIQVCADAGDPATGAREVRALSEASALFPAATCHLLTASRDGFPAQTPPGIMVQPAYEWMLAG